VGSEDIEENLGGQGEYQGDSHVGSAVGKSRRFKRHVVGIKCTLDIPASSLEVA
jgi:hypothetical protein